MKEEFPTRREADVFSYEKSEKYQAIKELTDLGLLRRLDDVELFHGRAGNGDPWKVKPDFDNSDNNTAHRNIHNIPALDTTINREIAEEFASARSFWSEGDPEVHKISSEDQDACVIDAYNFFSKNLRKYEVRDEESERARKELGATIKKTLPGVFSGSPLPFECRNAIDGIKPKDFITNGENGFICENELEQNSRKLNLDKDLVRQVGSALNTRRMLISNPQLMPKLVSAFNDARDSITIYQGDKNHVIPISREYLASWFRGIHAVGYTMQVNSATIGKNITNYLLFDLENVNTLPEIQKRRKNINKRFGEIALNQESRRPHASKLVERLTNDLYIDPKEIISLAKKTPGYKEIFEADAGNWERFTLEQHTETVLELFDKNYADLLPAAVLPIMRLALLVHDIGKTEAAKNLDKQNQRDYNVQYAHDFMEKNDVDQIDISLVLEMISNGMNFANRYYVKRDRGVYEEFHEYGKKTMQKYLGKDDVDEETITGYVKMLEVLQTCDSAAYTTMAVTRSSKDEGIMYRNSGSFNNSFEKYRGLTRRRARLRRK